eukprot:367641_1
MLPSYVFWVVILGVIILSLKYISYYTIKPDRTRNNNKNQNNTSYDTFKFWYTLVFVFSMFINAYYLFYIMNTMNSLLWIIFVTHTIFGTFIGVLSDIFGSKNFCIIHSVIMIILFIFKQFESSYSTWLIMVLFGISTSILVSNFESWLICSYHNKDYSRQQLSNIVHDSYFYFSFFLITLCVIKIKTGITNDILCILLSITISFLIYNKWGQVNTSYGSRTNKSLTYRFNKKLKRAFNSFSIFDQRVIILCIIQSTFETSIYLFLLHVFKKYNETYLWIIIFQAFGCGTMISHLYNKNGALYIFIISFSSSMISLTMYLFSYNKININVLLCILFAVCSGLYYPVMCLLRNRYVTDSERTSIMNIFRIPLNIIILIVLIVGLTDYMICICIILLIISTIVSYWLLIDPYAIPDLHLTKSKMTAVGKIMAVFIGYAVLIGILNRFT